MAGKIDFTVSANSDKALADLAKVINKQEKMIDKLKEQNRESKKMGKSMLDAGKPMSKMVRDAAGIAAGFASATAVIGGFKAIIGQLKQEMEYFVQKSQRAGATQFGFTQGITEAIRTTYGTDNLDRTAASFYSARPGNVAPGEIGSLLQTFKGAHPGSTDPNDFIAAMQAGAGPVSPAGRQQQIGLSGQLSSLMPGYSAGDSASVASLLINQTGAMSDKLPAAMQGIFQLAGPGGMGADPEAVLSRMVTATQRKMKPRAFTSMASTLQMLMSSAAMYKRSPGSGPDARGRLYEQIQAVGGDQDIDALMGFLDQLPSDQWKYISSGQVIRPAFGPGIVSGGQAGIRGAIEGNLAGAETAKIRASGVGGFSTAVERGRAINQQIQLEGGLGLTGQISSLVKEAISNLPGRSQLGSRLDETMLNAKWAMGADPAETAIQRLGQLESLYGPTQTTTTIGVGAMPGRTITGPNPNADPALIAVLQQLQVTIRDLAAANETINQSRTVGAGMD